MAKTLSDDGNATIEWLMRLTEHAVRSIAARWSWSEQLKLWDRLKNELHL